MVASPLVYAQMSTPMFTPSFSAMIPPVYASATYPVVANTPIYSTMSTTYPVYTSTMASTAMAYPVLGSASLPFTSIYDRPSVVPPVLAPPVYNPIYSNVLPSASFSSYASLPSSIPTYSSLPSSIYSPSILPSYSSSILPSYTSSLSSSFGYPAYSSTMGTSIYTPSVSYTAPAVTASFSAPYYANTYVSPASYAAPYVVPTYVPSAYATTSGGFSGRVRVGSSGPALLFDVRGQPVVNTIRNNFIADTLEPLVPGIGGYVSTANDLNLIRNAPRYIDNVFQGEGYRRDPFGAYIRNDLYADQLSRFVPSLSGSLDTFNRLNFYSSILN